MSDLSRVVYVLDDNEPLSGNAPHWLDRLDERQQKEVALARTYARDFNHGTPGHLHYQLINKMAQMLDLCWSGIEDEVADPS